MENKLWNLTNTGMALIGAGFVKLDDLIIGLSLIGAGVVLQVLVAVLNKYNIPVSTPPQG